MADLVKYIYGTEVQILALTVADTLFIEKAFYYPSDKDYFYQLVDSAFKKYGSGDSAGVGVTLNDKIIGGVKSFIESDETLSIPEYYEYNLHKLTVDGMINCYGTININ